MEISVVVPVFNAEKYVECAVESALQQKETAEVILVEDNSPDNALCICERLSKTHPRVRLIRHSDGKNHGAGESRNLGIRNARYDYIAFLDADDYYLENRFTNIVRIFEEDSTVDGVYGAVGAEFDNEEARHRYFQTHHNEVATIDEKITPEELFHYLVLGKAGHIHLDGLVVRKDGLLRAGLFPSLRLHQDMVLTVKLAAMLKLVAGDIHDPVAIRRVHLGNRITDPKINFSATRFNASKYLLRWSQEVNLPKEKQGFLRKRYRMHGYRLYKKTKKFHLALYFYAASRLFGN